MVEESGCDRNKTLACASSTTLDAMPLQILLPSHSLRVNEDTGNSLALHRLFKDFFPTKEEMTCWRLSVFCVTSTSGVWWAYSFMHDIPLGGRAETH